MLKNDYLFVNIGVDTAENEPYVKSLAVLAIPGASQVGRREPRAGTLAGRVMRRRPAAPAAAAAARTLQEVRYVNHTITFFAVFGSEKVHFSY